jgi:uncharacterized protein (DUF1501 family)
MTRQNKPCSCSRRSFLKGSGLTLAGFGAASLFPEAFIRHAMAMPATTDNRFLFIFLRGGNDGINAVIPHGDAQYNLTTRPGLYINPGSAINLNGYASFNPGLADMMPAFNAGELAVVHRAGFPNSRSHFDDQRVWENGDPAQPALLTGWLGRYILENGLAAGANLLPALSVQPNQPVLLRSDEQFVNIADPSNFNFSLAGIPEPSRSKILNTWQTQYAQLAGLEPYGPILSNTAVKLSAFVNIFESWDQANWDPKDPDNPTWSLFPVSFATNPDDPAGPGGKKFSSESYDVFRNLKVCALALLESDPLSNSNATRVAGTEINGWDLHSNQPVRHIELLSWLAYGFRSLRIALSGAAIDPRAYSSVWNKTVVSTLSEFGRTSAGNGSGGTDHGGASCMWIQGGNVNGGVYNCDASTWPSGATMFSNGSRDVAVLTDFRAIFWEILRDSMGADPAAVESVFPGYTGLGLGSQELGLINTI